MRPLVLLVAAVPALVATPARAEDDAQPAASDAPPPVTPEEIEALRQRIRQLEIQMDETVKGADAEGAEEVVPLDLETKVHGYADTTLRSYLSPDKQRPLTFRLGSMVLRYDVNLDRKAFFNTELQFEALDDDTFLRIEKVDLALHLSDAVHLSAGKTYTPLTYQSEIGVTGAYRFLAVTIPETMEPEHSDPTLPLHSIGVRATGTVPIGYWQLHYAADVSNGRRGIQDEMPHLWDYDWGKAVLLGTWVESPGGLTVGGAGYFDIIDAIPDEMDEGETGLEEDALETIGAARVRYKGSNLEVLSEAFFVYHADAATPSDGVWSTSAYAQGGYKIHKVTPYARFEYNHRKWDSVVYRQLSWPHMMARGTLGFRYDVAVHAALKAEYGQTYEYDYHADGSASTRPFNPSLLLQLAAGF